MDLEEYEQLTVPSEELGISENAANWTAKEALDTFDANWYNRTSQLGRWMDIIGDYAGDELFLVNGDSLLGIVLDDPLLAMGRENDLSFQFLHARYSLERALKEYKKRNAFFKVVFFEDQKHVTYRTGTSDFVTASRRLARALLKLSLIELSIPLHTFESLDDPEWDSFVGQNKPMFVITDDGGPVENVKSLNAERALIQRTFVYDLLTSGFAIALMRGTEYRDSKIFSFIYEQRRTRDARDRLDARIWMASRRTSIELDAKLPSPASTMVVLGRKEWLISAAKEFLTTVDAADLLARPLLYVFLAQGVILDKIPIEHRAQDLPNLHPKLDRYLRETFFPSLFVCLERITPQSPTFRDIDLDGRIFLHLLQAVLAKPSMKEAVASLIGPELASNLAAVWDAVDESFGIDVGLLSEFEVEQTSQRGTDTQVLKVLPFSHPAFDEHLSRVRVHADTSLTLSEPGQFDLDSAFGASFNDNMHWHSSGRPILPKHLGGDDVKISTLDSRARWRALRQQQRFQTGLQRQAQTLTGALGKPIETMVIPPVGTKAAHATLVKKGHSHYPSSSKKTKPPKMTSTEKTRQQAQASKQSKKDSEDSAWWSGKGGKLIELQQKPLEVQIHETELLLRNQRTAAGWLAVEVPLYRLDLELRDWISQSKPEDPVVQDRFRIHILKMIKDQAVHATPTAVSKLTSVLTALGFSVMVSSILGAGTSPDRELSFDFVRVLKKSGTVLYSFMKLKEHPTRWLLRCFGEYMDRSLDSQPDHRVHFEPDGWQREVLDSLDNDASVLVVAPTSAGKTFISYYAMERVLRGSDDGILVYVAPTKALVTQIAAEVSTRFKKDINGRSCWAIHTRDYRIHDPQKCQILITVPEVLAIMLLSPPLARVWTPKLKRIILDEIHSIGQQEGGSVWEQILLLAPCPVIGLSATVGDPNRFNSWLSTVQTAHQFQHTFINHPHRYSHLRKYFYLRSATSQDFMGPLTKYVPTNRLRFLHPVSMLASGMARPIPPDFALEPRDCLTLFDSLLEHAEKYEILQSDIVRLHPERFFTANIFLKQKDILKYEQALKEVLSKLIRIPHSYTAPSALQAVVRYLTDPEISKVLETSEELLAIAPREKELQSNLIHLLSDLHAENDLPALVFSFDRHFCETQAQELLTRLENAESHWRETSPGWKSKIRAWELYESRAKERQRAKERLQRQRPDDDQGLSSITPENSAWESSFDPSDPSPEFSFAGVKTSYNKSSLDSDLRELSWSSTPKWAIQAIKRGIAVHHSGMNRRYRNLVETLFRIGFLRVVIATGTLALGINAPCKTVIFCGDSTFLTALQYRQAAGRAGRRGYDLLGKVVFYGITLDRVQRLVLSRLPSIAGQFPLSTTLCLRLFNLLAGSQNASYAVKAVEAILSLPQVSVGSEIGQHELLHHLRFSIDYLRRVHLLNSDGQPLNLTGLATHLYYHEPSNLALVTLLRCGIIHKICKNKPKMAATRELMLILCYLFGRRHLPRSALNADTLRPLTRRYPSMIVLPALPRDIRNVLVEHGALTLRVFAGYSWTYASQNKAHLGPDTMLPLSDTPLTATPPSEFEFLKQLRSTSSNVVVRSAFVATSGHTDSFTSVRELCREARGGLHLNESSIPSMDAILGDDDSPFQLNAYLLDFYIHGQVDSLVRANGIRRGDVWYLLQDFVLTLKTIQTSIQDLLINVSKTVAPSDTGESDFAQGDIEEGLDVDDGESVDDDADFVRPPGVGSDDWTVYEIFSDLAKDYDAKFRQMWA